MERYLCIHGHFYQPPREDPWLDKIFPEGSAAPYRHWNERICRESYAPMGWARRMDGRGRICDIVNCFEWTSFNFGPTLMRWMERADPAVYERIILADKHSVECFGHGNAMAQVCHHAIMPLASDLDKHLEVEWGIADFEKRFGRFPEGMWLAEAAVDTPTLEVLAEAGIQFTLLAPRQVQSVAPLDSDDWRDVNEWEVDLSRPYRVELPSGRSIAVFFYNGGLSQAVAFERLLEHGDNFWNRLNSTCGPGLTALATDGETYGHHFKFGEMALAYVLEQANREDTDLHLTNFGAFLASQPPVMKARLHEPSSWSCVHGVQRWCADCGCTSGGHPEWNQAWRAPLRNALDLNKERIDDHFFAQGENLFSDPRGALLQYGRVYSDAQSTEEFEKAHFLPSLSDKHKETAWKLLSMQNWALSSFASCAWFFDDLARIEPLNALTYTLRSLQLARETGIEDYERDIVDILGNAYSNQNNEGDGAAIWQRRIRLRSETPERLAAQGVLRLWAEQRMPAGGETAVVEWPGVTLHITLDPRHDDRNVLSGTMDVTWRLQVGVERYIWSTRHAFDSDPLGETFCVQAADRKQTAAACSPATNLPWQKKQALARAWIAQAESSLWQEKTDLGRVGAFMFLPWQDYQYAQTSGELWTSLYSGLIWNYVLGEELGAEGEEDLTNFLAQRSGMHPSQLMLTRRLTEEACAMVRRDRPSDALVLLKRARKVGLDLKLWNIQNTVWDRAGDSPVWEELDEQLGMVRTCMKD
jgi:hypothetical protein